MPERLQEIQDTVNNRTDFDDKNIILPKGFTHFGSDKGGEVLYIKGTKGYECALVFTQEGENIIAVGYKQSNNGSLVLAGGETYEEIPNSKKVFKSGEKIDLSSLTIKEVDISGVNSIFESIKKVPKNYREYYNQEVNENNEPIISLKDYKIDSKDVYGTYAKKNIGVLLKERKMENLVSLKNPNCVPMDSDINDIKFDVFSTKTPEEKENIIRNIAKNLEIEIKQELDPKKVESIRELLVLSYNNNRLKDLNISENVSVRKEVAEKLAQANRELEGTGFSLRVSNGLRTGEMQEIIKENDEILKGKTQADTFFASKENSPHLSGGAIDIDLIKDGKKINLNIGKNTPETKSPLYIPENPTLQEQEILKNRQMLLQTMYNAGFIANPTEYWHFSYGDKMWAYVMENTTGKKTNAFYDKT